MRTNGFMIFISGCMFYNVYKTMSTGDDTYIYASLLLTILMLVGSLFDYYSRPIKKVKRRKKRKLWTNPMPYSS